jgi:hypothetical protein
MRSEIVSGLSVFIALFLVSSPMTGWSQEQPQTADQPDRFESFKEQVPGQLPSGHVPEGDVFEPGLGFDFRTDTREEAQQRCDEHARANALQWCTARETTYSTLHEENATNWYCVCH